MAVCEEVLRAAIDAMEHPTVKSVVDKVVQVTVDALENSSTQFILDLDVLSDDWRDLALEADHVRQVAQALRPISIVETLVFKGCFVHALDQTIEAFAQLLVERQSSLCRLFLRGNDLGDQRVARLFQALEGCDSLREIDLEGNQFQNGALTRNFLQRHPQLETFKLDDNGPFDRDALHQIASGLEMAGCRQNLRQLSLEACFSGDAQGAIILEALLGCQGLRRLRLGYNNFRSASVAPLAALLERLSGLEELCLRDNNALFTDKGSTTAFAQVLNSHPSLQTLDLSETGLSGETAWPVFRALATDCRLQELKICFEDHDDCPIKKALRHFLPKFKRLQKLHCTCYSDFDNALFASVQENTSLLEIHVWDEDDDSIGQALDFVCQRNRNLRGVTMCIDK